jgi:hypothetical protein
MRLLISKCNKNEIHACICLYRQGKVGKVTAELQPLTYPTLYITFIHFCLKQIIVVNYLITHTCYIINSIVIIIKIFHEIQFFVWYYYSPLNMRNYRRKIQIYKKRNRFTCVFTFSKQNWLNFHKYNKMSKMNMIPASLEDFYQKRRDKYG